MDVNGGIREERNSMDLKKAIIEASKNLNLKLEKHSKENDQSKVMIYRVHKHLKDINCNAYEPNVISIGPYHRGKVHLKRMEDHKLLNLQLLAERKGIDITKLPAVLKGVASKARKCYADHDFKLSESEFIEMLVLDGCFIIQFVQTCVGLEEEADPIFQMRWLIYSLRHDLMLFENQIPFFVLRKLFKSIYPDASEIRLVYHLSHFFRCLYPGSEPLDEEVKLRASEIVAQQDSQKIMHILDLIHRNWLPRESQKLKEEKSDAHAITIGRKGHESQESEEEKSDTVILMTRNLVHKLFPSLTRARTLFCAIINRFSHCLICITDTIKRKAQESQESEEEKSDFELINCATSLTEANVKFKVKKEATCLFDIKFKDGTMAIPPLRIDDGTECSFRNLIAYEQYFKESPHNLVTQYRRFLDCLINSSKDVEILSQNHIIENWLGDDESVANMVNRLGDSIVSNIDKYAKLYEDVNEHCRKPKNRWVAKLRRDYLSSPWAIISVSAAAVLLVLTIAQTVLSLLQVVLQ